MTCGDTTLVVTTAAGLEAQARQELRRLLPESSPRPLLLKGNVLVTTDIPEDEAVGRLAEADTRFIARAVAVQRRVPVTAEAESLPAVAAAAVDIGRIQPGDTFLVRCHRRGRHNWQSRDLEQSVAAVLEATAGGVGDYSSLTTWLVSVEVYQERAYIGINSPSQSVHKVLRQQRKYAPGERPLNRSELKLREALQMFEIELPEGAWALDLGSAPGGWAKVLSGLAAQVVAVDPAELDESVSGLPNVEHLRCGAEEIAGRTDWHGRFDLLTCDMNRDPAEAATTVCRLALLLKPLAPALMTLKYTTKHRRKHDREAIAVLSDEFEGISVRRLPHNRLEATASMRRKGAPCAAPNFSKETTDGVET